MDEMIKGDIERINKLLSTVSNGYGGGDAFTKKLAEDIQEEVVAKYKSEMPHIAEDLSYYWPDFNGTGHDIEADYFANLKKIKGRLEVFIAKRKEEEKKPVKQPVSPISIVTNNNNNSHSDNHSNNSNTNTNSNSVDVKVLFEEARKTINDDGMLNDVDAEEILNKINELEELHNSDEVARSKWSKSKEVMTWLFDKGAKVASTVLPLIAEVIK